MRIACSGSREFSEWGVVGEYLGRAMDAYGMTLELSFGDARGADYMAWRFAIEHDVDYQRHICHWPSHGTRAERWAAAHERNQRVLTAADLLLAFRAPGELTPGTSDTVRIAHDAGIPGFAYYEGIWRPI